MPRSLSLPVFAFTLLQAAGCGRDVALSGRELEAREAMLFSIAAQFRESPADLKVLGFQATTWRDACLAIPREVDCGASPTPGFRVHVQRRGQRFEFRAPDGSPSDVVLAAGPGVGIGRPALVWRWPHGLPQCQTLVISPDSRPAIGACGAPLLELEWLSEATMRDEWTHIHQRFAPFSMRDESRTLEFFGTGSVQASPSWQRAIMRWSSLRWGELRAGRSGAAYGRAMSLRRPILARPGFCDILEVTEYGTAYAGTSSCDGGSGEPGRTAWLSDELWEQFDSWYLEWGVHSDELTGTYFFGAGPTPPSAPDVQRLRQWSDLALAQIRNARR